MEEGPIFTPQDTPQNQGPQGIDILQQPEMLKEMASSQIDKLLNDMNDAFRTLSEKEGVPQADIQLAVRYDSRLFAQLIEKTILGLVTKHDYPEGGIQLRIGFKRINEDTEDCNFYYQIMKEWKPIEDRLWLTPIQKAAMEYYLIPKLQFVTGEYKTTSWTQVSLLFHIQKGVLKMSLYTDVNDTPVFRKNYVFAAEPLKHLAFVYFEILKQWQPVRRANFATDFLNADSILKDEREDLVRMYVAGGEIGIPGMKDIIPIPGNLDVVAPKYGLAWNDIAFIFSKQTEDAKPTVGVYAITRTEGAPLNNYPDTDIKFELKESVDIFSLKDEPVETT